MIDFNLLKVDAVFCISLETDNYRRSEFTKAAEKVNLAFKFHIVKRHKKPELGCALSHQQLCQIAIEKKWDRILIFEDDCRFNNLYINFKQINKFLDENNSWEIFYLGGMLGDLWLTRNRNIARIRCACTHSYIVNISSCRKITKIDFESAGQPIDRIYKRRFKAYSCFPLITEQDVNLPSNIAPIRNGWSISESRWGKQRRSQYFQAYIKNVYKFIFTINQ